MRSKQATAPLDHIFYALSDPTRRGILAVLSKGEAKASDLAGRFDQSMPAISKHLKVLERGKLIERRDHATDGRAQVLVLRAKELDKATDWLEKHRQYWNDRFDELEKFLEENPEPGKENG
ncbi:MAG TPA: metalloregulator ArsR/SmtB family transcription factor [bacterium]|nr:metalloregulator ArsR/SmtB family transcription factor [bacterium]